jgi:hypothetical protein
MLSSFEREMCAVQMNQGWSDLLIPHPVELDESGSRAATSFGEET